MDLWIRSQDKRELRPNPKLGIDEVENKFYIVDRYDFERANILGTYKTKERALEVLDEIQNILFPKFKVDTSSIKENGRSWVENGVILQSYTANVDYIKLDTCVYEMPKE